MKNIKPYNFLICLCLIYAISTNNTALAQDEYIPKLNNPITVNYLEKNLRKSSPKLILTPVLERKLKSKLKNNEGLKRYFQYLKIESEAIMEKPLKLDKAIKNLKRSELRIPAWIVENNKSIIKVRLFEG